MSNKSMDPVTYQVVRNRLIAATEEMRIALQSVSGSPTVTEASDFYTGLFLADGTFATMGFQVTFEAPPVSQSIKYLIAEGKVDIRDGDMFVCNDPWIGALHQNDIQMVGPIFHAGEIVAWAGVMAHQTDVGGMDFASWCPKASEVYQEGQRIPGVRLVEQGEVRGDILDFILSASRLPAQVGLDLRAFIATINVARERVADAISRYGIQTFKSTMARMLDLSEARMLDRLSDLPDGVVRARTFMEHDGHANRLYRLDLVMTKKGRALSFDFSGSSPQAPGFINCTRAGLMGAVTGAILPVMGWDVPWNAGLMRPVDVIAPDGLICTALHPAPVGAATVEAVWALCHLCMGALNKLIAASPALAHRAQAVSTGTMATFNLGGVNQYGERFGFHSLDPQAGGAGAYASKDGMAGGGPINSPMPAMADVEINERWAPLRYIHRRIATDSGGAGASKGGEGVEMALTLGGIKAANALVMTHGLEVPNAMGLGGGWPGATVGQRFGKGALVGGRYPKGSLPHNLVHMGGDWQDMGPKPGHVPMTNQDIFHTSWQGGGGWGDPLDRDPAKVTADLEQELITKTAAKRLYGVVIRKSKLDAPATRAARKAIK
ncbi:MAG: hydantoinase B/oxoprolinase family protein, partial [Rhodospirillales bacterium]|nr:hydantoinase B/oxoprolinase family protein [Rhodospirillales bacterium]